MFHKGKKPQEFKWVMFHKEKKPKELKWVKVSLILLASYASYEVVSFIISFFRSGGGDNSGANPTQQQTIPRPQPKPCSNVSSSPLQTVEGKHRVGSLPEVTISIPSEDHYGGLNRGGTDQQNVKSLQTQPKSDPFKSVVRTPDCVITIPSEDRHVNSYGQSSGSGLGSGWGSSSSIPVGGISSTGKIRKEERWIKYYSSSHKILLVGEGDFSFSACLAKAFGSAAKRMLATSLNSEEFLRKNYIRAMSNIQELKNRGAIVMHEFDATQMANYIWLKGVAFDRIVYNFPHAGFITDEPKESQIRRNQKLISSFLENAKKMISENGEIHISHKCNGFFRGWNIVGLARQRGLDLIVEVEFQLSDYPGYETKYGYGGDNNFDCYPSKTYKFGLL